ncbi:MAG: hypothetical protein R3F49_21355 [Planctomycetota bacterium]
MSRRFTSPPLLGPFVLGLTASCAAPALPARVSADRSGTNPTLLRDTLEVTAGYASFGGGDGALTLTPTYTRAFRESTLAARIAQPLGSVDLGRDGETGLGDLRLGFDWLAQLDQDQGVVFRADVTFDTASNDALGAGRATLTPALVWTGFLSEQSLLAFTWQQRFSVDGAARRDALNQTTLDLRYLRTAADQRRWWSIDPAVVIDLEAEADTWGALVLERGWVLGDLQGGALGAFVRPSVGFGGHRENDWTLLGGLRFVL